MSAKQNKRYALIDFLDNLTHCYVCMIHASHHYFVLEVFS